MKNNDNCDVFGLWMIMHATNFACYFTWKTNLSLMVRDRVTDLWVPEFLSETANFIVQFFHFHLVLFACFHHVVVEIVYSWLGCSLSKTMYSVNLNLTCLLVPTSHLAHSQINYIIYLIIAWIHKTSYIIHIHT